MAKKSRFLLGAVIGGTAAAVAALLLAPKSGKELRKDLAEQADQFKDKASDYTEYAKEKGDELSSIAKDKADSFGGQASGLAGNIKERSKDSFNRAQDVSGSVLETLRKQTDDLSSRFKKTKNELSDEMDEFADIAEDTSDDIFIDVKDSAEKAKEIVSEGKAEAKLQLLMYLRK